MKQNLLKLVLLGSTLSMALCGCGETPTEEPTPTETETETETPTVTETETETAPVVDEHAPQIELARYIFLEGEDAYDDLIKYDVWSAALQQYKSRLNTAQVTMPETCENGEAEIIISAGRDSHTCKIWYYKDAATAAAMTEIQMPEDVSSIFNEAKYIKDGKLQFEVLDGETEVYVKTAESNAMYKNKEIASVEFNTNNLEIWYDTTKMEDSSIDPTKKTLKNYTSLDTTGATVNHTNCTYYPSAASIDPANMKSYEIITDAEGKICYLAPLTYSSATWALASATTGYWSYYKDFTTNPAFVFAEDYDAETNPEAFQKVLPEGGNWIIGYNIKGNEAGYIDNIWTAISGTSSTIYSASASIQLNMEDAAIEASLMGARIKYDRKVKIYSAANSYQLYAYYYSLALASGDAAKLAYRDEIYEAIIKQELPAVQAEPVLFNYYEGITLNKIAEWGQLFK